MQYLGFPLVGDYLYNPDMEYIHRQALHSWKLSFIHPITREPMEFTAELPDDMKRFFYSNSLRKESPSQSRDSSYTLSFLSAIHPLSKNTITQIIM